jgi:hypothetical protein
MRSGRTGKAIAKRFHPARDARQHRSEAPRTPVVHGSETNRDTTACHLALLDLSITRARSTFLAKRAAFVAPRQKGVVDNLQLLMVFRALADWVEDGAHGRTSPVDDRLDPIRFDQLRTFRTQQDARSARVEPPDTSAGALPEPSRPSHAF